MANKSAYGTSSCHHGFWEEVILVTFYCFSNVGGTFANPAETNVTAKLGHANNYTAAPGP